MLISLTQYAENNNRDKSAARRLASKGKFKTAQKIGRNWVIDSDEIYPDGRVKSGKYINWRKK